jgi:hypothetical protein
MYAPLPDTLAALKGRVDLIVGATVTAVSQPTAERTAAGRYVIRRHQRIRVTTVLHGDGRLEGRSVTVLQSGGTVVVEGIGEVSAPNSQRLFQSNDEVVLLLQHIGGSEYYVAYGPDGAIWIDDNSLARLPSGWRKYPGLDSGAVPISTLRRVLTSR